MNDSENETVRFSMKPNPVLYALEFTRHVLLVWTLFVVIPSLGSVIYVKASLIGVGLLITYVFVSLVLFVVAVVTASHLMFVVTDKRAIVRSSFREMTADVVSIAIETVKRIEITSYGATYGNVYLSRDRSSPRENSEDSEPDYPQQGPIRRVPIRASVPIKRTNSIWVAMNNPWPSLFGFFGFKGFDELANIISEQHNSVPNVKGDHDAR